MTQSPRDPIVAILNTSPRMLRVLSAAFELAGFRTIVREDVQRGDIDVAALIRRYHIDALVYDISPRGPASARVMWVITTTARRGRIRASVRQFETPIDARLIVEEVRRGLRRRS
jgi:hypothetical protein